ncbi:UNVERIFIED_CONTAM: hypothetical protein HDU68_002570 [Siphonaria sp. JEL0065]|nr:hypothetical protein HDU68_002570 [Siphonaria sp. JEL0065]
MDDTKREQSEAAQIAMKRTVDALGRRIQNRVFEDQLRRFCSVEKQDLINCREMNNKNPTAACVQVEKLFDKCTENNVRLVSDFRQACRKQVVHQTECIGGIYKPQPLSSGRMSTCNDVVADLADCIGMGWTTRTKKAKPTETDLLAKILSSSQVNVIGNYVLGKTLGEGSFGKVKLATHSLTGQEVAVKVVDKIHAAVVAREIETWRHLHHPNIAQLYEVLTTESKIYMFTEYCAGGEAFDFLCNVNRMDDQDPVTRKMFREIVEAVAYCHEKNFVHRDLKLENVLLTEDFTVKVIDFGFTRPYNERNLLDTYCGSVAYAAPEMITGKKYSGPRADIWSLGVILYTLLCGYLPFDDDNEAVVHQKINALDYELPDFLSEGIYDPLPPFIVEHKILDSKSLISQILQINPTDRISVQDILSHPWFTAFPFPSPDNLSSPNFNTPEETQLCMDMVDLGLNVESILESVCGDACDASSALWYLLLKERRMRRLKAAASAADATTPSGNSSPPIHGSTEDAVSSKREESGGVILPPFHPTSSVRERSNSAGSKESTSSSIFAREDGSSECVVPGSKEQLKRMSIDKIEHPHAHHHPPLHHTHHLPHPISQPLPRSRSSSSSDVSNGHGVTERISSTSHSGNSLQMLVGTHHQIHSSPLPAIGVSATVLATEGSTHIHQNPPSTPPARQSIHMQQQQQQQPTPTVQTQLNPVRPRTAPPVITAPLLKTVALGTSIIPTDEHLKTLQVEALLAEARRRRSMNLPHQNGLPAMVPPPSVSGSITGPSAGSGGSISSGGIGGNARRTSVGILSAASSSTSPNSSPLMGGDIAILGGINAGGSGSGGGGGVGVGGNSGAGGNRRGVMIQAMRGVGGGGSGGGQADGSAIPQIQLPDRPKTTGGISGGGGRYGRRTNTGLDLNNSSSGSSATSSLAASPKIAARPQILEEEEGEESEIGGVSVAAVKEESTGNATRFGGGGRRKRTSDQPSGSGGFVSNLMASFSGRNTGSNGPEVATGMGSRSGLNVAGVRGKSIVEETE